jgi:hypothetical protein
LKRRRELGAAPLPGPFLACALPDVRTIPLNRSGRGYLEGRRLYYAALSLSPNDNARLIVGDRSVTTQ